MDRYPRSAAVVHPSIGWTPAAILTGPGRYRRASKIAFDRASLAMYLDDKPEDIAQRKRNIATQRMLRLS